jgi:hypothetical protein
MKSIFGHTATASVCADSSTLVYWVPLGSASLDGARSTKLT